MDAKKIILKEQTTFEIYLINEEGTEHLGDYTFPEGDQLLYIDGKVFGRLIDIMTMQQLSEWGYSGQEMWIAETKEQY